ncbi:MAG TPA: hypothetical protein QF683_02770 [SAR324 cluster bacterium]|nr:hypothetical protein [SAR324 cluster bacterium]
MQTDTIKTTDQIPESLNKKEALKFSLDGNLGLQIAFITGITGILYYFFSCACPS